MVISQRTMNSTLKHAHVICIACLGMWLLSCVGVFLVVHFGNWWFFLPSENTSANWLQFGGFYIAYFAARIPSAYFVALVISKSEFKHPVQVASYVVTGVETVRLAIQLFRNPWLTADLRDWWMPLVFDLWGVVLSVILVGGFIRLLNTDGNPPRFAEQN